jgi:hypothetical protein
MEVPLRTKISDILDDLLHAHQAWVVADMDSYATKSPMLRQVANEKRDELAVARDVAITKIEALIKE